MSARGMAAAAALLVSIAAGAASPAPTPDAAGPSAAPSASAPASASAVEDARCPPEALAPTEAEVTAGMHAAVDSGLLWKATKAGRTVYLYGTIHVAQRAWMYPGPQVMRAILASDVIALELDPTDPAIIGRLQQAIAARPDAPPLPDALQQRLLARIRAACLAPASLAGMRPEMQAISIEVQEGREFGLYPIYGIDGFLAVVGRSLGKPIRSLETPESQAELLVSDDPDETASAVEQVLDELEGGKGPQMLRRLAGDWQRGDLDDLGAYASWCACLETPQERADFVKLVDDRNPLMVDKIVRWQAEGRSLFVAVGSLHLVGPGGLPALLKARGFDVQRIVFRPAS